MADASPLSWIARDFEAHCLTLARGLSGRELLLRLGCSAEDLLDVGDHGQADALRWDGDHYWDWGIAHSGEKESWAFALEPASVWASDSARLAAASRDTAVLCTSSADAMTCVAYWENGELVTAFEDMAAEKRHEGGGVDPDRLVDQMRRVGLFDPARATRLGVGLDLLYEVTGVTLTPDDVSIGLAGKLPAFDDDSDESDESDESDGADGADEPGQIAATDGAGAGGGVVIGPVGGPPTTGRWVSGGRVSHGLGGQLDSAF
ncbi:DUF6461 domain-containing protein [Streptomyces monticola]|uniref:DUF6461 domain-containing protein n=1 Tax=Streptomyces monticola TaxID=2666263 RepID=A0ABW2JCY5_9ACTN